MKMKRSEANGDLLVEVSHGVAQLTLNRPGNRNALSSSLLLQLQTTLTEISSDRQVRVVVLAANGPVFCSGHDLNEILECSEDAHRELFTLCANVMQQFRQMPQPVIARVQGLATAAGCQLVASCDLVVATNLATFATPGVKIGLFCTTPMVPLVRSIAPKAALEMLFTARPISAQRALELGLVNCVVSADEIDAVVSDYAHTVMAFSPEVLRLGKAAFYDQLPLSERDAYLRAVDVITSNAAHDDAREGISAFLEKRPPKWSPTG